MELEHKDEKGGCKKISVGVYILKNTHEEGHAFHSKKNCINKCIRKNDQNERKRMRKEGKKV